MMLARPAPPVADAQETAMTPSRMLAAAGIAGALTFSPTPAAAAGAADYPTLKAGQWDITTTSSAPGSTPRKSTICLDAATQKSMFDLSSGMQKEMCTRMDTRRDGASFIADAECRLGNSTVTSHAVMTMLGDTSYRTESTAKFNPPLNNLRESKTVVEGKYAGGCRDGLKPGDVITSSGQRLNLNQLPPGPSRSK
jgi:hypothetical protein